MGLVISTLDNTLTKVSNIELRLPKMDNTVATTQLTQLTTAVNKSGFYLMKIDINKLKIFLRNFFSINSAIITEELDTVINKPNLELGNMIFSLPSLTMFYTLVASNSNDNFQLLIPKGFIFNDSDFFGALDALALENINKAFASQPSVLANAIQSRNVSVTNFRKAIAGINRNTFRAEVRMVNIGYLIVNQVIIGYMFQLLSEVYARTNPENRIAVISNAANITMTYVADFLATMPENQCLFPSNSIVTFTPDICATTFGSGSALGSAPGSAPGSGITSELISGVSNTILFIAGGVVVVIIIIIIIISFSGGGSKNKSNLYD
jgi:hypothetical protein